MSSLSPTKLIPALACSLVVAGCSVPLFGADGGWGDDAASASNSFEPIVAEEQYVDVDPELFIEGSGATIAGTPGSGVLGCYLSDETPDDERLSALVSCQARFRHPMPEIEFDGGWPAPPFANVASFNFETGEFETGMSPGSQGFMYPPRALEPGERVTIYGTTIYHLHDGGFRAERAGVGYEVHKGVIQHDWDATDRVAQSKEPVPKGTVCGVAYALDGQERLVVAAEDNTICPTAMDTMDAYIQALRGGDSSVQGSAALWQSPENWSCSGRYFFDDEEYVGANGKLTCREGGLDGAAAAEGSGSVVALKLDELGRL